MPRRVAVAALLLLGALAGCTQRLQSPATVLAKAEGVELKLVEDESGRPEAVEATGFLAEALDLARRVAPSLQQEAEWQRLFAVRTAPEEGEPAGDLPTVTGEFVVTTDGVRFLPRYPFARGQRYRATWTPAAGEPVVLDFAPVRAGREATTRAVAIYPTSDVLPANLLRMYVEFSAPMRRGEASQHVRLLSDPSGDPVEFPFVAAEEELWNEERTRLTLLFDPGRIKRGVAPHEEVGSPLQVGGRYRLVIDQGWRDAEDLPLRNGLDKLFLVDEPDRDASGEWKITAPFGRRAPLLVELPSPFDYALLQRTIEVRRQDGQEPIPGSVRVSDSEKRWTFQPNKDWKDGSYILRIDPGLEDPSGNTIARPFETTTGESPEGRGAFVVMPFEVQLRAVPSTARR
jgi:hypothetical protein